MHVPFLTADAPVTWAAATVASGVLPLTISDDRSDWYASLEKPAWTPPAWMFPLVWTTLNAAIGFSSYLALGCQSNRAGEVSFAINRLLSTAWTPIFFKCHAVRTALRISDLIIASALTMLVVYSRVSPLSGRLLLPYIAWMLVARRLNSRIAILNSF